jgi:hypothetical protein
MYDLLTTINEDDPYIYLDVSTTDGIEDFEEHHLLLFKKCIRDAIDKSQEEEIKAKKFRFFYVAPPDSLVNDYITGAIDLRYGRKLMGINQLEFGIMLQKFKDEFDISPFIPHFAAASGMDIIIGGKILTSLKDKIAEGFEEKFEHPIDSDMNVFELDKEENKDYIKVLNGNTTSYFGKDIS